MATILRSGMWLEKKQTKYFGRFDEDPDRGVWGRLEILVAGSLNCRVHREAEKGWVMMPTERLLTDWAPMRAKRRSPDNIPLWVREGTELIWTQRSWSGSQEFAEHHHVQVNRVRGTWFSFVTVKDGRLWFYSADHHAKHPNDLRPIGPIPRFERSAVV